MRDQLLSKVQARISSALASQEYSLFLGEVAESEERDLRAWLEMAPHDDGVRSGLGWWHWLRHLAEDPEQSTHRKTALEFLGPAFVRGVGPFPEPLLPELAYRAKPEASAMMDRVLERLVPASELAAAISLYERIVAATARNDPNWGPLTGNLAYLYRSRFDHTTDPADLDLAVESARACMKALPEDDEERPQAFTNLADLLRVRSAHLGGVRDLDEAVTLLTDAVGDVGRNAQERVICLMALGSVLDARFEYSGDRSDLDAAIRCQNEALDLKEAKDLDFATLSVNLSQSYLRRFEWQGGEGDLEKATGLARIGVELIPEHDSERGLALVFLGAVLRVRFQVWGEVAALDDACAHMAEADRLIPDESPRKWPYLIRMIELHRLRFEVTGDLSDLHQSIVLARQAIRTLPEGHHDLPAFLNQLVLSLKDRAELVGDGADLDEAVETARVVLRLHADHPEVSTLMGSLSNALSVRFARSEARRDLDEAISLLEEGIRGIHDAHRDRPRMLSNLSLLLRQRFLLTEEIEDLDRAIDLNREAIDQGRSATDDQRVLAYLVALANALRDRFDATENRSDLDEAVTLSREVAESGLVSESDRARALTSLGFHLEALAVLPDAGPNEASESAELYERVWGMRSAPVSLRCHTAVRGARALMKNAPERALRLFEGAIELLPQAAPHQTRLADQQDTLRGFAGAAADAAALVLDDTTRDAEERAWRALELLEAGRAVTLGHGLTSRTDISELQELHPELAQRFVWLRDTLDTPELGSSSGGTSDRHVLAAEFDELIARVRTLPGFTRFCLPPDRRDLLRQASEGPVAVVNNSSLRCDALVLTATGPVHVPLTTLRWEEVAEYASQFHFCLRVLRLPGAEPEQRKAAQKDITDILGWAWDHITGPVLDALGYDRQVTSPEQADWSRVWWVPVGLVGILPLHASGHHGDSIDDPHRRTVLDRVVSSYTPTIRALGHTRARAAGTTDGEAASTLIVGMPTTPGLSESADLHHVPEEVVRVNGHLPGATVLCAPGSDGSEVPGTLGAPTGDAVMDLLPGVEIAHFACHGTSHPTNPALSQLHLADQAEKPFTSQRLGGARLDRSRLAYLSACRTSAIENVRLLDEVVHLSSALQLAGFRHVVGTLWEIDDRLAVTLADRFYAGLRIGETTELDTDRSAWALHQAVRYVREAKDRRVRLGPREPFFWAGVVHTGA